MSEVGIRALKQNASAVVSRAAQGETITITDRGRPVARLTPTPRSALEAMIEAGQVRLPRRSITDLPAPTAGEPLTRTLIEDRSGDRY